jgi:hypothetical protein
MAAASSERNTDRKDPGYKAYPVLASTRIYKGTLVAIDNAGYATPATNAASQRVVGVADAGANNSAGASGAINVVVREGVYKFAASSITQAMVGQMMYVVDDQTFDDAIGTAGIKAGRLVEFVSTTEGWIHVKEQSIGAVTANADATYGQPEADLINELKAALNSYVA